MPDFFLQSSLWKLGKKVQLLSWDNFCSSSWCAGAEEKPGPHVEHPTLHQPYWQHDTANPDGGNQGQLCHPLLW